MKKIIGIFPSHYDWSGVVGDGLAFGIGAAVFCRIVPAILRAARSATGRLKFECRLDSIRTLPNLKIFGQRH